MESLKMYRNNSNYTVDSEHPADLFHLHSGVGTVRRSLLRVTVGTSLSERWNDAPHTTAGRHGGDTASK